MTPKEQLDVFIDRFTPEVAKIARGALARMRKLTPGALELVYDNYNALAIGFSPTERSSDGIFSIALYPPHASLFFLQGAVLPDPKKRLRGAGNVVKHVVLEDLSVFEDPDIRTLIGLALERAKVPLDAHQRRRLIIKSVAEKQRPRRPAVKAAKTAKLATKTSAKSGKTTAKRATAAKTAKPARARR